MLEQCQGVYKAATIYSLVQQSLKESKGVYAFKSFDRVGDQKMCEWFV